MTERLNPGRAPGSARRTPRLLPIIAAVAVLVLGVGVAGGIYLFGRSAPAPVGLDASGSVASSAPLESGASQAPTDSGASQPPTESAAPPSTDPTTASTGRLDGTWTVDPTIGSFSDFSGSFAGYRVQEVLVGIGAATAVGRTPDVTGSVVITGTTVTEASFQVDLRTLRSDSSARDGQLRRQGLETDRFPTATFTLAEPIALGSLPAVGAIVRVDAVGDLTLHGTTKRVTFPLEARLEADGTITVTGSLQVDFADFGMTAPQSFRVLSVDPRATIELQLHFRRG
jgi:polyisoprenoid-binding protein YceI